MKHQQVAWLLSTIAALMVAAACASGSVRMEDAPNLAIHVDWSDAVGPTPRYYGVESVWVDQDAELFIERYRMLGANTVRVQVAQLVLEPVNDNDDPESCVIDWNQTHPMDQANGKTITYGSMFSQLASEFPEMHFQVNIWLAASWNADKPNGYLGIGGTFPPRDYAEHREFVGGLARWLVDDCGIDPLRLAFSFVNEPNSQHFFTGSQADLVRLAAETRIALDVVSPGIQMLGLDEVNSTAWTEAFYPQRPSDCCDGWTFHVYERGTETVWNGLRTGISRLSSYGPVWVTEFADTNNGSPDAGMDFSTRQAAIGYADLLARLWHSDIEGVIHFRLADTYVDALGGWAGHGLFADWRGAKSNGASYAIYPSFWVFSNMYNYLTEGQIVRSTAPPELRVVAVRPNEPTSRCLVLWITNTGSTAYRASLQITGFPTLEARMEKLDNLAGPLPIETRLVAGSPLTIDVWVPAQSSYTILLSATTPSGPEARQVQLPLIVAYRPSSPRSGGQAAINCSTRGY